MSGAGACRICNAGAEGRDVASPSEARTACSSEYLIVRRKKSESPRTVALNFADVYSSLNLVRQDCNKTDHAFMPPSREC